MTTLPTMPTISTSTTGPIHVGARRLRIERATSRDGKLRFSDPAGLRRALADGCFYLEIPADLNVTPGVTLSREFYKDTNDGDPRSAAYRGMRDREGIYFDREHFQTEHVLIDGPGRARHFPPELVAMCDGMNAIALQVMRHVLEALAIPEDLWATVSGGAIQNRGTHWFASSHYRSHRDQLGCAPHKDTGFVTVLYIDQEGLEALVDGRWIAIDPSPGCFVINFGASLEILTEESKIPVQAILHRVRRIPPRNGVEDRFSFAAFVNPPATGWLYKWRRDDTLARHQSVEEFLIEFNEKTWNDRHNEFGIR